MLGGLWEQTPTRVGDDRRTTRVRRSSSWSARTPRSRRWSTSGWRRTGRRWASRRRRSQGSATATASSTRFASTRKVVQRNRHRPREERRSAVDAVHARHGRQDAWPRDQQGRPIYPEGFEELAAKRKQPLHPPGRDVRCIVSVGMLTEGWDCNTVTHIVGLRPFMSQLLCEQVVGRGLRRRELRARRRRQLMTEEVAKVFGVPFEVIPFKANPTAAPTPTEEASPRSRRAGPSRISRSSFPASRGTARRFGTASR